VRCGFMENIARVSANLRPRALAAVIVGTTDHVLACLGSRARHVMSVPRDSTVSAAATSVTHTQSAAGQEGVILMACASATRDSLETIVSFVFRYLH